MGALDRMRQAGRNEQKSLVNEGGALSRMKAAGAAQTKEKKTVKPSSLEIASNKGGVMGRVASDFSALQEKQKENRERTSRLDSLKTELDKRQFSDAYDMAETTKLQKEYNTLKDQLELGSKRYENDWGGQAGAKNTLTKLSEAANAAGNVYFKNPTEENRKAAQKAREVLGEFQRRNQKVLSAGRGEATLSDSVQSFIGYLPQLQNQLQAGVKGAVAGAGVGSVVPVVGTMTGAKAGYVAASAMHSYEQMRGAVFMDLLEMGVEEEMARKAAGDEALVASLYEMGDSILDVTGIGLGVGSLLHVAEKGMAKAFAKKGAEAVADTAAKKLLKAAGKYGLSAGKLAGKYGLNVAQEYGEEGIQQATSIANRDRIIRSGPAQTGSPMQSYVDKSGTPALREGNAAQSAGELMGMGIKTAWDALTGKDLEAREEIHQAGLEGAKIAAISGGVMPLVQTAVGVGAGMAEGSISEAGKAKSQIPAEIARQAAQTGVDTETGKDTPAAENASKLRGLGRATVDYEQFREEYAKRVPETTEEQTREQFELFKGYASGQDVVETADGPMTRAEIKERLAGLQEEREIDQLVDSLLDEREAQAARETISPAHLDKDIDSNENGAHAAETALANKISEPYTESEVTTNVGEEVHLRDGGQWSGSADSGGQVSVLEEGAGRVESRNTEGRPADREAAALTYAEEKVSARSLGITGGTADANIHVVTGGDTQHTRVAREMAQERGLELVLFTGGNLDIKKGGVVASARAYIEGNRVFVRADHPVYTADQLMRHETGHDMIAKGEIDPNTVRERIGADRVEQVSRMYAEAYAGSRMTPAEIWEEIICDSVADMNIFAEQENTETAAEVLEETKKASIEMEAEQNRGPPEGKMSRETNKEERKDGRAGEEVRRDSGHAESKGRTGEYDTRGTGSRTGRYARRIKEILLQSVQSGNNGGVEGNKTQRVIQRETAEAFESRIHNDGMFYYEGSGGALAFTPATRQNENASTAQKYLEDLGIDVIVFEGELQVNRGGTTERLTDAVSFSAKENPVVFVSADLDIDGLETAYHEGFHIAKLTHAPQIREDMMSIIADAVDVDSESFVEFIHEIADMYGVDEHSAGQEWFAKTVTEEAYAWYIGRAYSSESGYMGRLMRAFSDVPATKAKLDEVFNRMPEARVEQPDSGLTSQEPTNHAVGTNEMVADIQESVRAAVREELNRMGKEYGWIKAGENPVRDIQMPKRTSKDKKLSQTVRTVMEAGATPEAMLPDIEQLAADGAFSFESYSDKQAIQDAAAKIGGENGVGWNRAQRDWFDDMKKGKVSKELTTMGWTLYNNAANSGDTQLALDILDQMVRHQRNAAQALQATRILKKLSPEAQLYQVQRSVNNLQDEINQRYGDKKGPVLKVDEDLAEQLLQAETQEERDEILKDIYRDIGKQMPSRFVDKWNAWRYLAMLGNPRTHVRNIVGNAGFAPVVAAKNLTATAIETAVSRVSGGKLERTKGLVGLGKDDRALLKAAWGDYTGVAEAAMSGGKYDDLANANKYIDEGRVIFKTKALETARKKNSTLLEKEDVWFSQPHYAAAMAQYCKANGITAEQLSKGEGLDKAREYAVKEAQKATYRDANTFSKFVSELGRKADSNKAAKAANMALEGILPFRKTPANILVRGVEYSPIGLVKSLTHDLYQVKKGDMTGAEAIDNISAGLTGSMLLGLGVYLAAQGLVRGSGEGDDKEKKFDELQGRQTYSMELGDTSVTLDWLAPECLPFFVGVNLWEQSQVENVTFSDWMDAIKQVGEPMLEMSCLQSLNDAFDSMASAVTYGGSDGLTAFLISAATSYITQGIPTLGGQIERSSQADRMTTYVNKDSWIPADAQYVLGRASSRLPLDYNQIPYIDAWGRKETENNAAVRIRDNMANPAYMSQMETSAMEEELKRLYKATGESVFPSRADRSFTVNKEKKNLTGEEYVEYATQKGQISFDLLTELTGSQEYKAMDDADKARAVSEAYSYANAMAKTKVSDYEPDGWIAKARECEEQYGISVSAYITAYAMTRGITSIEDKRGNAVDNSKGLRIMEQVYQIPGLTKEQYKQLASDLGAGTTILGYSEKMVKRKLEAMERKYLKN